MRYSLCPTCVLPSLELKGWTSMSNSLKGWLLTQLLLVTFLFLLLPTASWATDTTITSFTQTSWTGTLTTITGSNFTGTTAVKFNGVNAFTFTVVNSTTITAQVPNTTTGPITITNNGQTATSSTDFYIQTLLLSATVCTPTTEYKPITITASPSGGGDIMEYQYVLLNGNRNFVSSTSYSTGTFTWTPTTASQYCVLVFARVQGTNYYVATQETLVTVLPVVTNLALTASPATTAPAMTPITLTATATVTAGCTAEYKFMAYQNGGGWSTLQDYSSSLVCTWTPTGAQSYTVFVYAREVGTTIYCAKMSYISYTVTPQLPPTITGLSATCGVVGDTVTITGTNFTGATSVKFGTTAATTFTVNDTTITVVVPAAAVTGPQTVTVTTPYGTGSSGGTYTVKPIITITTNFPDLCAGDIYDELHQVVITISARTGEDVPVVGYNISVGISYGEDNLDAPEDENITNLVPTLSATSGTTDTNGEFQIIMQAGKLALTLESYGEVVINAIDNNEVCAEQVVSIVAPGAYSSARDVNDDEVFWFSEDDDITLYTELYYDGCSVEGQDFSWSFKFWENGRDPLIDTPNYEGTGYQNCQYGMITDPSGTTDADGVFTSVYTAGSAEGYVQWYLTEDGVYEYE